MPLKTQFAMAFLLVLAGCSTPDGAPPPGPSNPSTPAVTYTVTYHAGGAESGLVPVDNGHYTSGTMAVVQGNTGFLWKTAYHFSRWDTDPAGHGTGYLPGEKVTLASRNLDLYAQYAPSVELAAPVVTKVELVTPSVDTTTAPATVQFKVTGTDDMALKMADVYLVSPSGASNANGFVSLPTSVVGKFTGTPTEGTFLITVTLPRYSEAGDWAVSQIDIYDHLGKTVTLGLEALAQAGWATGPKNTATVSDTAAPVVTNVELVTPSVDTTTAPATVQFKVTGTDDMALKMADVYLVSPSEASNANGFVSLPTSVAGKFTGTPTEGTFLITVTLPRYSEAGDWTVSQIDIYDHLGKTVTLGLEALAQAGWATGPKNTATISDTAAPVVTKVELVTPSVDTTTAPATVQFKVTATDDMALKMADVYLVSPSGASNANGFVSLPTSVAGKFTGTPTEGTFLITITLPRYSEAGDWAVSQIDIYDHLGKTVTLGLEALAQAGWDFKVTNGP